MNASKRKAHRDSDQKAAKRRRLTSDNVSKLINVASVMPGDDLCASEEDDQDNDDISDHDSDEQEDNISEGLTSVGRFPRRRATADDRETDNDGYIQSQRNRNIRSQHRRESLFKKGQELASMSGGKVLVMHIDEHNILRYYASEGTLKDFRSLADGKFQSDTTSSRRNTGPPNTILTEEGVSPAFTKVLRKKGKTNTGCPHIVHERRGSDGFLQMTIEGSAVIRQYFLDSRRKRLQKSYLQEEQSNVMEVIATTETTGDMKALSWRYENRGSTTTSRRIGNGNKSLPIDEAEAEDSKVSPEPSSTTSSPSTEILSAHISLVRPSDVNQSVATAHQSVKQPAAVKPNYIFDATNIVSGQNLHYESEDMTSAQWSLQQTWPSVTGQNALAVGTSNTDSSSWKDTYPSSTVPSGMTRFAEDWNGQTHPASLPNLTSDTLTSDFGYSSRLRTPEEHSLEQYQKMLGLGINFFGEEHH